MSIPGIGMNTSYSDTLAAHQSDFHLGEMRSMVKPPNVLAVTIHGVHLRLVT